MHSDRPTPPTKPIAYSYNIKQRSPLITHKTRSPSTSHQTAITSSTPTKSDRLFPSIKQRSPLITHKPDCLSINKNHQTLGCKF
ncbi:MULTISPECIES: hypothetical protein [Pseudanabaena]|uniref:hypothetical protein n=1 Tax=Pseudanabaena TaxID=1152 RepID=UPI002479D47C|nr:MULTISPECIES: hypothetical protein [Pseudanabaena]MEA5489020.1 hypothetical protein [Pseudanabaena sp. CCNP1317]WGS72932.1 hypothetical protein OA858_02595 [Pseudanabaena galeata CCNP1313]